MAEYSGGASQWGIESEDLTEFASLGLDLDLDQALSEEVAGFSGFNQFVASKDIIIENQTVHLDDQVTIASNETIKSHHESNGEDGSIDIHETNTVDANQNPNDMETGVSNDAPERVLIVETDNSSQTESYTCSKCDRIFSSLSWFVKHLEKCQLLYECGICQKIFRNMKCLKEHRMKRHGNNFQCEICDSFFNTEKRLEIHKKKVHEAQQICSQCKVKCKNLRAYRKHLLKKCKGGGSVPEEVITTGENSEKSTTEIQDRLVSQHEHETEAALVDNYRDPNENSTSSGDNCNTDVGNQKSDQIDKNDTQINVVDNKDTDQNSESKKKNREKHKNNKPKLKCGECPKTYETRSGLKKHMAVHRKLQEKNINNSGQISIIIDGIAVSDGPNDVTYQYVEII